MRGRREAAEAAEAGGPSRESLHFSLSLSFRSPEPEGPREEAVAVAIALIDGVVVAVVVTAFLPPIALSLCARVRISSAAAVSA